MHRSARVAIGERTPTNCEASKTQGTSASRPTFASRMIRLVFKRGQQPIKQQAKSWPGRPEPVREAVPTTKHQLSTSIDIPNSLPSSPATEPVRHSTRLRVLKRECSADSCNEDHWRHRQTYCANCERLFFKSTSSLSSSAGRFCSLDCKANFEYVAQLQSELALGIDTESLRCGVSFDSTWQRSTYNGELR